MSHLIGVTGEGEAGQGRWEVGWESSYSSPHSWRIVIISVHDEHMWPFPASVDLHVAGDVAFPWPPLSNVPRTGNCGPGQCIPDPQAVAYCSMTVPFYLLCGFAYILSSPPNGLILWIVYSVLACAPPFKDSCCFAFFNKSFYSLAGLFISFSFCYAQVLASVLVTFLFAWVSPTLSGMNSSCLSDCLWPGAR